MGKAAAAGISSTSRLLSLNLASSSIPPSISYCTAWLAVLSAKSFIFCSWDHVVSPAVHHPLRGTLVQEWPLIPQLLTQDFKPKNSRQGSSGQIFSGLYILNGLFGKLWEIVIRGINNTVDEVIITDNNNKKSNTVNIISIHRLELLYES